MPDDPGAVNDLPPELIDAPSEQILHAATARRLLEVRERCAERLRRLKGELAASRAKSDLADPDASVRLVRTLDFALRRLQDIIDEACTEVLAELPDDSGPTLPTARPGTPVPAQRNGAGDGRAEGNGAGAVRAVEEPEDQALAWVSAVQEAVPLPVVAYLLKVMHDVPLFNHIAQERPRLMAELLSALPPTEAARWLEGWEPESAAEALAAAEAPRAAEHVALMPPETGAALLARMGRRRSATLLSEMRGEPAARRLIAMGAATGAPVLDRMERGAASVRLLFIRRHDPELAAKFLSLMSEQAASECVDRMDQEVANQRQARELLKRIGDQRQDAPGS
ncbi:hypothetical protein GCM10023322_36820 [Rugosimonospora acidiphila]|uniref:Magnesium transporter MgtE intracellular domain-containing protein n=1 Tax=Rugosimonospora acidiphila TaxID=556531 RepID=A0ABP9RWX2_9ACTN